MHSRTDAPLFIVGSGTPLIGLTVKEKATIVTRVTREKNAERSEAGKSDESDEKKNAERSEAERKRRERRFAYANTLKVPIVSLKEY